MSSEINILHLEDNSLDEELIHSVLKKEFNNCNIDTVVCKKDYEWYLKKNKYDLILADYDLPSYDGLSALKVTQKMKVDIPFIFVTGKISEDTAIDAMKEGATDYVFKDKLKKLIPAIQRAMNEYAEKKERIETERYHLLKEYALESSSIAVIIVDLVDEKIIYTNRSLLNWLDCNNELLNYKLGFLFDSYKIKMSVKKQVNKEGKWRGRVNIKKTVEEFIPAYCFIDLVKDEKGKSMYWMISLININ